MRTFVEQCGYSSVVLNKQIINIIRISENHLSDVIFLKRILVKTNVA